MTQNRTEKVEKVEALAEARGYTLHNYSPGVRYNFIRTGDIKIGIVVYPQTDEFEIYYNVDLGTTLSTGKCGSFHREAHFSRLENGILKYARALKEVTDYVQGDSN